MICVQGNNNLYLQLLYLRVFFVAFSTILVQDDNRTAELSSPYQEPAPEYQVIAFACFFLRALAQSRYQGPSDIIFHFYRYLAQN